MKPSEEIDVTTLIPLLDDYFPRLRFFDFKKRADNLDIRKYFYKEQDKWIPNIAAMSRSENYACLFPKDISHWDESQARSKYGSADVIRFFIYEQNETFFSKISCLNQSIRFDKKSIPDKFLSEIDYYEGKDVWELWDFNYIVVHKMRHDPPSIYEAFTYYARSQYNLLAFALNDASYNDNNPLNNDTDHLINRGRKIINSVVDEHFPKEKIQPWLPELQQEILESVPNDAETDVPRELEKFIEQLKSGSGIHGIKRRKYDDLDLPFTKSDIRTINNLLLKLDEDKKKIIKSGTLSEKVDLLRNYIEEFSKSERTSIDALFLKRNAWSLDKNLNEDEDEKPSNLYDVNSDEQHLNPEDSFIRRLPLIEFENEFKDELGEKLNPFLELLQEYFEKYPLPLYHDFDENLKATKYPINQLFKTFCSLADIPTHEGVRKQFLVMFKRAINNIKRSEKD